SRGKGIMTDVDVAPSAGVSRARSSFGPASSFRDFTREWDAPHQPTLMVLPKEVFKDPSVCKTVVDQFPTPGEMVRIEALSSDQLTAKMSVLHCLMMSHGGEILARYRGLLLSHRE
ncbi:hypothetical protein Tco_0934657, partial [Tanacetum coccineum]